ncbi:MAG: hypothetical protein Unbinned200contig1000_60 [Prokaryotic dsDNA virus sp.]|jgi:hypothetical protein|nr:hypothetical protein [Flavobacteriaceae bacterium]QDP65320.1 MAG: hypothetical protein Unbinned200contig1000_60 [Prokaryotic dsDNA virus sp.]|tara:strand:+ start:3887 stop:5035 length:1149 start_codon:yes stop_codon:yes gene_type:complete
MTVYFSNPGVIDLDVIKTMGVSVKETDNPIGFFGTGLKYAIATLLRTDHAVTLISAGEKYEFNKISKSIRGKEFHIVCMNDEQLGFTTELGKNWQVWQAYRELYSNTMDEMGSVSTHYKKDDTVFAVSGPEIDQVHAERGGIFLQNDPWIVGQGVEVHRGKSEFVYYRGVRVHRLPEPSRFTYNLTCPMSLTEDRTLASAYDLNYKLSMRLPRIPDPAFANGIVDPNWDGYEVSLDFSDCYDPSEEFLDALEKHRANALMKEDRKSMLLRHRKVTEWDTFTLTPEQEAVVNSAFRILKALNCYAKPDDFTFVETLGPGIYAQAKDGKMLITRQTIANGVDFLAITMYEEWIHDKMGYHDESRGMQQFLFDKILELVKRELDR